MIKKNLINNNNNKIKMNKKIQNDYRNNYNAKQKFM